MGNGMRRLNRRRSPDSKYFFCPFLVLSGPQSLCNRIFWCVFSCFHVAFGVFRGHSWRVRLAKAGYPESTRAPGLTSGLHGSVNVHRGALLLVPQWQCISSFVFYISVGVGAFVIGLSHISAFASFFSILLVRTTPGTRVKRSRKSKANLDKCTTGKCKKGNNLLVKRIGLKVFSTYTLLMLFNFYLYLYRICWKSLYHFVRALCVCPACVRHTSNHLVCSTSAMSCIQLNMLIVKLIVSFANLMT